MSRSRVTRRLTASTVPVASAGVDDVAHPVLVLEQHEDPGQEVADQALRAEPDGQPEHPGAGQHRGQVQPEIAGDGDRRDAEDDHRRRVAQHRAERRGPLPPPLADQHVRRVRLAVARLGRMRGDLLDQPEREHPDDHRHQQHEQDLQHQGDRAGQPHIDQFGGVPVVQQVPGQPAGDSGLPGIARGGEGVRGVRGWCGEAERREECWRGHWGSFHGSASGRAARLPIVAGPPAWPGPLADDGRGRRPSLAVAARGQFDISQRDCDDVATHSVQDAMCRQRIAYSESGRSGRSMVCSS